MGFPYGAILLDAQGKQLGTCDLDTGANAIDRPAAAWDGKGWAIACYDGAPVFPGPGHKARAEPLSRIVIRLVSAEGTYEGVYEVSSGKPNPAYAPAACGDGKGNTLVVWERHPADADPLDAPILIAARIVKR